MKNRNMMRIVLGAGVSLMLILASCSGNKKAEKAQDSVQKDSVKKVFIQSVSYGNEDIIETFTSQITADVVNNISAQGGGRLEKLYVKIGDRVSRGQILARFDASQLNQSKVHLENAQRDYNRMRELYEIGGISKSQMESAESALRIAREQSRALTTNTILRSPISGVITAKNYDEGDVTSPTLPILVVQQLSPVKLIVNVSELYYKMLKRNMPIAVEAEALEGKIFSGKISNIYPTIDPSTHTIGVEISIANPNYQLRPGMYAKAIINFGEKRFLFVPDKAVLHQMGTGDRYVFIFQNGKAISRKVELGELVGDKYEVISGLSDGENVITSAVNALSDGESVSIAK